MPPKTSPPETASLFGDDHALPPVVGAAEPDPALESLATALPQRLWLGTSSWHYPGWAGLVWDKTYGTEQLSRHGLAAYARHPLFRAVGLDRGFYRPLSVAQYSDYAGQVPDQFRFVVKAPSRVTDALCRGSGGQGLKPNPDFLDINGAWEDFVAPACTARCRPSTSSFPFCVPSGRAPWCAAGT